MSGTKRCPFCGENIKSVAVKCRYCGEFLEGSPDSRQPGQELVGQVIGEYRLTQKLGEGGMAEVYLGVHEEVGQQVATKVLNPGLARDPVVRERFIQEARIQIELRHPGIVRVLTANTRGEHLALMMEYVEGRTLADIIGIEVGPVPMDQAQPLIEQVLSAMSHAHHQGVIHRDIKPSNILVSNDGVVKVMDFGIAKVVHATRLTRTGATLGTATYMAPEQIQGSEDADERSDIYALGVTFYEMLAGRPPFEAEGPGDSDFQVKMAHVNKAPPDPRQFYPDIPQAMVDVLMRALAKEPAARYQTVAELQQDLAAVTKGAPLAATPLAPAPPARRVPITATEVEAPRHRAPAPIAVHPSRRPSRTGLYLGLAGGLAALVMLMVLLLLSNGKESREAAETSPNITKEKPSAHKDDRKEAPKKKTTEEKTAPPPAKKKADEECKQSAGCKTYGQCTAKGSECIAASDAECKRRRICKKSGQCTVKDGRCVAGSDAGCRRHSICKESGQCTLKDGRCVAGSDADCRRHFICKKSGQCTTRDGKCVAVSHAACRRHSICRPRSSFCESTPLGASPAPILASVA